MHPQPIRKRCVLFLSVLPLILAGLPAWPQKARSQTELNQALLEAVGATEANRSSGNALEVETLLRRGANPNSVDKDSVPALTWAANKGNIKIIKTLLLKGARVNTSHPKYGTALMQATALGKLDIVKWLVSHGADIHIASGNGWVLHSDAIYELLTSPTAFLIAVNWSHNDIASYLLRKGAKADATARNGTSALLLAAARGDLAMVRILLAKKVNVNHADKRGETPLMMASSYGHIQTIELLLKHGARINAQTTEGGSTALMWAASQFKLEAIKTLLAAGADVNLANYAGQTALFAACNAGDDDVIIPDAEVIPMVQILLAHGAKVNIRDKKQLTPLKVAESRDCSQVAALLKKAGATE